MKEITNTKERTNAKLRYARVHLEELRSHQRKGSGDDFERSHQESFLFHLLGARDAFLQELNLYYNCGLELHKVRTSSLNQKLDKMGIRCPELNKLILYVNSYLFRWDDIPGNDNARLIKFLERNFGIDWVKTAKIEKIDNGRTIKVSTQKNYLSLKLNDEQTEVNLEIDDDRTDKFVVKIENSKLQIYKYKECWLHDAEEMRNHFTHRRSVPRVFYAGGEDDGKVSLRNPRSGKLIETDYADAFEKWCSEMETLLNDLRNTAISRYQPNR